VQTSKRVAPALHWHLVGRCAALMLLAGWCAAQEPAAGIDLGQLPQSWRDDRGREIALTALRGRRVVLTMAYANCHFICPMTIENLERMQKAVDALGEKVDFVIVSYDPKTDTPDVWQQYRQSRRLIRDNWYFLSGSREATERLAHQLGFPFWQYDDHVMHESRAVLFDSQGIQRAAFGSDSARWSDFR
jgi:protein SCO1/2